MKKDDRALEADGATYHMPAPMGRTALVRFDLVTQQILVRCRRNADGTCVLEIDGSGELKVVPLARDAILIEPVSIRER